MKEHYESRGIKNAKMQEAIADSLRHGRFFFKEDTMNFWRSAVEYGMFKNNTFVTSEDDFNRTRKLFTARHYDWDTHSVETIGKFQQFKTLDEAIVFAKSYKEETDHETATDH